jgi:hypothetical protein
MMTRSHTTWVALIAAMWLLPACGSPPSAAETPTPVIDPATAIDPAAVAAIERMGAYLLQLKQFAIRAETATDEVLMAGPRCSTAAPWR